MSGLVVVYTRKGEPDPSEDWFKRYGNIGTIDRIETFEATPGYIGWAAYPVVEIADDVDAIYLGAEVGMVNPQPYMEILKKGYSTTPPSEIAVPKTELGMCLAALIRGAVMHTGKHWKMAEYNLKDGFINFKYVRASDIEVAMAERMYQKVTMH